MIELILLIGPPGSGKGTLGEFLSSKYNLIWISMGDLIRKTLSEDTELSKTAREIVNSGKLLPDEITNRILTENLPRSGTILLDGYPRKISQAEFLEKNFKVLGVIFINCDKKEIIERTINRRTCPICGKVYNLKTNPPKEDNLCDICKKPLIQREDDTEQVIRNRLEVYEMESNELRNYYERKGLIYEIENIQKPLEIYLEEGEKIMKKILKI
ncbi:MAG: nucleoside monophosphate kinase [Candidatus Woesearchaeota archaeon]